jgi:hypothetical protein
MAKKKLANQHCSVPGCKAKQPHTSEFLIRILADRFAQRDKCLQWVQGAMAELHASMTADITDGRLFAWYTRMRQVEELYFKTLYILFLATDDEVTHILSGQMPNSFSVIYDKVNNAIMGGRAGLKQINPGFVEGEFCMFDIINDAAHVGFGAMQMVANLNVNSENLSYLPSYMKHVENYFNRINYMRQMFEGGKDKKTVMEAMINIHRPKEYWEEKAKASKDAAEKGLPVSELSRSRYGSGGDS